MTERQEVTIENRHRYAVHIVGRRFRPGRPRTLSLNERQLKAVRGNPWLWIEGEDFDEEAAEAAMVDDFESWNVPQLKDALRDAGLPVSGNKDELIARLMEEEEATDDDAG